MRSLFAITYPSPEAARHALGEIRRLQEGATLAALDAVVAVHGADGSVKLEQSVNTTAMGAASGALWGSLIGLLFLNPLLGGAVGASAGAVAGYATDYGISDEFMKSMGARQPAGSATLFVLASDMTPDKVASTLGRGGGEVVYTSMPADIEERFKALFAPGESQTATLVAGETAHRPT